jgi:hypothetical protein
MPYPQNFDLALEAESILRKLDVVPATIAVKNGTCQIGLADKDLKDLARGWQKRPRVIASRATLLWSNIMQKWVLALPKPFHKYWLIRQLMRRRRLIEK